MMTINSSAVTCVVLRRGIDGPQQLVVKRCVADGGFWSHVGGGMEPNESAVEAIMREIEEETQLPVVNLYRSEYIETFFQPEKNRIMMMPMFVAFTHAQSTVTLNHEHTEYQWVSLSQAKQLTPFDTQHSAYDHVWRLFVERSPNELLKIF